MSDRIYMYMCSLTLRCNLNMSLIRFDAVKALRDMEEFTRDVGGYPFLYADIFMTRKEFDEMFDLTGTWLQTISVHLIQRFKWCP